MPINPLPPLDDVRVRPRVKFIHKRQITVRLVCSSDTSYPFIKIEQLLQKLFVRSLGSMLLENFDFGKK